LVDMRAAATGERAGDGEAYVYVLAKTSATISPRADGVEGTTEVGIQASLLYGPGLYQVDPWVTDRHNLRAAPRLTSPVVGNLLGGDAVDVAKAVTVHLSGGERETLGAASADIPRATCLGIAGQFGRHEVPSVRQAAWS